MTAGPSVPAIREGGPARVLFVITTTGFGGAERCLELLSTRLDRDRYLTSVCSLCPPGSIGRRIAESGVEVTTLGMSGRASALELAHGTLRLRREIDRRGVDLVHSLLYRGNLVGLLAARLSRRRPAVVASQHSRHPDWMPLATRLVRVTRPWVDRLVTVSEPVREEIHRHERIARDRVVLIENGVDVEAYSPEGPRHLRNQLDPGGRSFLVGAMGRLARSKGLPTLVDAARLMADGSPPCRIVVAGEGPDRADLERLIRHHGVEDRVQLVGYCDDVLAFYRAVDVLAIPSLTEGTPYSLLEAMACGLPIVATSVGGMPRILTGEGEAGLLVPPEDAGSLARALERLRADGELRGRLGRRARARVVESYNARTMLERYQEVFDEVLRERSRRRR